MQVGLSLEVQLSISLISIIMTNIIGGCRGMRNNPSMQAHSQLLSFRFEVIPLFFPFPFFIVLLSADGTIKIGIFFKKIFV